MIQRIALTLLVFVGLGILIASTGNWENVVVRPIEAAMNGGVVETEPPQNPDGSDVVVEAPSGGDVEVAAVLAELNNIETTPQRRIPDYERDAFGEAWADVDDNGCDTRNDILARDLTDTTLDGYCTIVSGTLADPYTGETIDFVRGVKTSGAVHIDHIVSLSGAWAAGAWEWSDEKRLALANDPANLLAADGPTNSSKSDFGPADWLPPNSGYTCTFVAQYTAVVSAYSLTITEADRAAVATALEGC